jgi:MFS transporter, putative metabolite:H+ symporter
MSTHSIAARLERLPATPALWRRLALLSLGGFFEFYDMFLSAYVAPGLVRAHILTTTTPGLFGTHGIAGFVAALFAGLFIGTALFGFVADRFGRRTIFTASLLWYSAASAVMAFQNSAFGLDLWRFIAGIGVGVELVTIDTFIAELVPSRMRGRAFAFNQVIQFCAIPVVALLAWLLVPRTALGLDGWRIVVLIGSAGAVIVWWIRLGLPESPRWLVEHGRGREADEIVSRFEAEIGPFAALSSPASGEGDASEVQEARWPQSSLLEIWQAPYFVRTLMLVIFNLFQTVGFYGFSNWVPTLLMKQGVAFTASLEYTFVIAIAAPFGPLLAWVLSDRVERKWLIVAAALAIAAFGLAFAQMRAPLTLIVFGVLVTLSNNTMSFSFHAYQAELYPTRIRAAAVGFVYSWSRLSTVFSAFLIGFVLGRFGTSGVFALIAASMTVVALAIGTLGPRTSRRPLEAISR